MAQTLDEKGNIIINGFSTNQTPSQYSNSNIPVSAISPVSPLNLPTPQIDTTGYTSAISNTQADIAGGLASATQAADLAKQETEQARNQGVSLANLIAGTEAGNVKDVAGTYGATGVNTLFSQLQDLNAQATGLKNEAAAIPIQEQQRVAGQGVTDRGLAPITTARLRDNALKALSLGQQYAIAEGNYNKAKNYADQLIDTKYSAETARINALKTQQAALDKYVLDPAQKKELEATKRKTDLEAKILDEKIANDKAISNMVVNASSQNAPQELLDAASKAKTSTEAAMILRQYAGDYYQTELLKAQIAKQKAETAKVYSDARAASDASSALAGSTTAQNWVAQYNSGALSLEDIYTKIGSSKEALKLKNEVSAIIAAQGGKRKYGTDDASVQAISAQIKNVNDLLNGGVGKIVGVVQGGGGIFLPDRLNVGKQDALAIAKNLVSNQTLQALADAKSKGITFGALSEGELGLVADSASRIAAKLKVDEAGNVIGFTGSEKQFIEDLKAVKEGLEKSIVGKTQSTQPNPFQQSLGQPSTPIPGTSIINSVSNSGGINFSIPK